MPKVELGRGCNVALHTYAYISGIHRLVAITATSEPNPSPNHSLYPLLPLITNISPNYSATIVIVSRVYIYIYTDCITLITTSSAN